MEKINKKQFEKLLADSQENEVSLSNYIIDFENPINIDLTFHSFFFKNCIFKGSRIDFYDFDRNILKDKFSSLAFRDCKIENDLFIKDCYLSHLSFENIEISSQAWHITTSNINNITLTGNPKDRNKITSLIINNLTDGETNLDIRLNDFSQGLMIFSSKFKNAILNGNSFNQFTIDKCIFVENFTFWKSEAIYTQINRTDFDEMTSVNSNFGIDVTFENVNFFKSCNFEKLKDSRTKLKFKKCNFYQYTFFDESNIYELHFDTAYFKEIVSFQYLTCTKIIFNRTHFDKVAFFNDMNINLDKCDLKTIRIIKNQLLNTENKIDYLKFNALEHKTLLSQPNLSLNDRFLLRLNKSSNNFGISWLKGILFTVKSSMFFFILLLLLNNVVKSKYPLTLSFENQFASFNEISIAFLKFVFSLGFENEEIQSNGLIYFIFIIAKIFIGYGIYQTIAAFRKYGTN